MFLDHRPGNQPTIGSKVVGGVNNSFLYADSIGKLASSNEFSWNPGIPFFTMGGPGLPQINFNPSANGTSGSMIYTSNPSDWSINGDSSFNFGSNLSFDGNSNLTLAGGRITSAIMEVDSQLVDGNNVVIVEVDGGDRNFNDGYGQLSLDLNTRTLFSQGAPMYNWQTGILTDRIYTSIDVLNRTLNDSLGVFAFGWTSLGVQIPNVVTSYNGQLTAANGVSSVIGSVNTGNQTASISDTTILTTIAASGLYTAHIYLQCISAGAAGTAALQLKFTDDSNTAQAVNPLGVANIALTLAGTSAQSTYTFNAKASSLIKYNTTVTGAVGSPKYSLRMTITKEQ